MQGRDVALRVFNTDRGSGNFQVLAAPLPPGRETVIGALWIGGPREDIDAVEKDYLFCYRWESNPGFSVNISMV
jgi:hypothetical protein